MYNFNTSGYMPNYMPNMNSLNSMNPYQQRPNNIDNINTNSLIRVTGIDGAKAYQMPPNSVVPLFDGADDIMYIKSTDGAGFGTIKTFRFSAIESDIPQSGDYISRAEFEKFKNEVMNYGKQFIQQSTTTDTTRDKSTNDK